MATTLIDRRGLERVLEVLENEERSYLPSRKEIRRFKLLQALVLIFFVLAFIGAGSAWLVSSVELPTLGSDNAEGTMIVIIIGLPYLLLCVLAPATWLLLRNLPVLHKLWRLERLRLRVQGARALRAHFREDWRRNWLLNSVKIVAALSGLALLAVPVVVAYWASESPWLVALGTVLFFGLIYSAVVLQRSGWWRRTAALKLLGFALLIVALGSPAALLLVPFYNLFALPLVAAPVMGAAIIVLYLIGRGKRRIDLVRDLRAGVLEESTAQAEATGGERIDPAKVQLGARDYAILAQLERDQIMLDRHRNLRDLSKSRAMSGLTIQRSAAANQALAELPITSRLKVDDRILGLAVDPRPEEVIEDPESGLLHVQIPEAGAEVVYQHDEAASRLRVYSILVEPAPRSPDGGAEDG